MNTKFYLNFDQEFERRLNEKPTLKHLVEMEHMTLEFWELLNVLEKVKNQNQSGPTFSFLDGPITANNPMGVHHAWGRTIKDVVQRFKSMQGYSLRYQNGFDTQGLWIEVEVEKSLNLNSKRDLEKYGLANFAEKCKERLNKYSAIQTEQSKRLGQSMDWDHSYYTHTDENISSIWHFLRHCHEKGWLYKAYRPMPWCARCGTSLSQHEQADSYKEISHTCVYAKLYAPVENFSLVVWTTTPWTLPANMAIAVHPELMYTKYQNPETLEVLVAGAWLRESHFKKWKVLETFPGAKLEGLQYQNLFRDLEKSGPELKPVVLWTEVSEYEGTGLVHLAPGCGAEDFELGKLYNLEVVSPLDENGVYETGFGKFSSQFYREVNNMVTEDLETNNSLFLVESYLHRYPHCWRCKEELVYRSVEEWFISTDEMRPLLKQAASEVKWTPEHVGKLFQNWLDNMGDWCISRKRFWGLPLPFYQCECGHLNIVSSKEEFESRVVGDFSKVKELHRPWVDEVLITCENCNQPVNRVSEVGDCWLDAGVTPFSTLEYFSDLDYWSKWYPANFICEMREQVRLWFYSTMFMGVALTGKTPYQQVVSYEKVHDKFGKPMHKSDGNAIWFDEAVEKVGADPLRLYYLSQNLGSFMNFNLEEADKYSKALLTFWNVLKFLQPLAKLDNFVFEGLNGLTILDKWLLSRLDHFRLSLYECLEKYQLTRFSQEFLKFTDDVSNWYLRRSRRRFWDSTNTKSKNASYATLTFVLLEFMKLVAPLTPFFSEFMYQNLKRFVPNLKQSVHLEPYPTEYGFFDNELEENMERSRDLVQMVLSLRSKSKLKVKQPLQAVFVLTEDKNFSGFLRKFRNEVKDELNVKKLSLVSSFSKFLQLNVSLNYKTAGKKFKQNLNSVKNSVTSSQDSLRDFYYSDRVTCECNGYQLNRSDLSFKVEPKSGFLKEVNQFCEVILQTDLNDQLYNEGFVREFLRHVQRERQRLDFELDQQVKLEVSVNQQLQDVLNEYESMICKEAQVSKMDWVVDTWSSTPTSLELIYKDKVFRLQVGLTPTN